MYQGVERGEMHYGKIVGGELSGYSFREGEYVFTFEKDGVKCAAEDGERFYSYGEVRIYRVVTRKNASNTESEKYYFTAPAETLTSYNRYRFKEGGTNYFTHEFNTGECAKLKKAIEEFSVPVTEKVHDLRGIRAHYKTFREDGGLAHRIVAISAFVFVLLIIGALIMYLINYFLHTDTDTLAIVFGIFCLPCLAVVVIKSQELGSKVKVYDKGVYLTVRSKSGYGGTASPFAIEKAYFTWDEIECVQKVQSQVQYTVQFRTGYTVYSVPDFYGLYDYIALHFPEKCRSKGA